MTRSGSKLPRRSTARGALLALALVWGVGAGEARGQGISDLRQAMEDGGGWVSFDVVNGRAAFESLTLPTAGIRLEGYFQIWRGNSGQWSIRASDLANPNPDGSPLLDVSVQAGQRVPFVRQTGFFSRLRIEIEWSDPGDTTLFVWVGLGPDAPPPPEREGRR